MSVLGHRIGGAGVVDLFAGSGALGLETLSRGAAHVTFVERSRRVIGVLERNIRSLGAEGVTTVVRGDALAHVHKLDPVRCDLALADPPYGRGHAHRLVTLYARRPFARELWIEHRSDEVLPADVPVRRRRYGDTVLTAIALPPAANGRATGSPKEKDP